MIPSWDVRADAVGYMPNERLRAALLQRSVTAATLAEHLGVDPKTVERWVGGRTPYRRHRYAIATYLSVEEGYLWPEALTRDAVASASHSEIIAVYPHRSDVPRDVWGRLFAEAKNDVGVLVYSGLFLAEDSGLQRTLADRANAGVRVRILLGDPESREVAARGEDEGQRCQNPQRPRAVQTHPVHRGDRVPVSPDGAVQLDLPGRRRVAGQYAHLRPHSGSGAGMASAEGRRRRTRGYLHGELRARLGVRPAGPGVLAMGRRIDFYGDPNAPKANSLVPSVNVVVTNGAGQILLIKRSDNDNWALPGGAIDLGESLTDAAIRETREETGIVCEITGLVGIYSDPKHVILYTSNGETRQEFSIVLTARPVGGHLTSSSESTEVRWVNSVEISSYTMDRSMRQRIGHYLKADSQPYLG